MEVDCNLEKMANCFKFFLYISKKSLKTDYSFVLPSRKTLIFSSRCCTSIVMLQNRSFVKYLSSLTKIQQDRRDSVRERAIIQARERKKLERTRLKGLPILGNGNGNFSGYHGVALSFTVSRSNWNLEMLVFVEGGKLECPEKNPRSRDENQQQTQPTYDAETGNRTRATLVGGECRSHHYAIPTASSVSSRFLIVSVSSSSRHFFLALQLDYSEGNCLHSK